jgi:uncharacterized protein YjbI with pentapeptide repeats
MTKGAGARTGGRPFRARDNNDYSGLLIENEVAASLALARSFFNGANLTNVCFEECDISNTELSEVVASQCRFVSCNLNGSDLVNSRFESTTFVGCDFRYGEWRESSFTRCRFENCNFDHATVTLSEFVECSLDAESLASADNRAFHYNVFSRSKLPTLDLTASLTSRNFGLPALVGRQQRGTIKALEMSLEELCHLNNTGQFHVIYLADAVKGLTQTIEVNGRRRNSALAFFGRIIRVLTAERRISATSLFYIESALSELASSTDDQDVLLATMAAMVEARTALLRIAEECDAANCDDDLCRSMTIHFAPTYPRAYADALVATFDSMIDTDGSLRVDGFENGSTLIEIVSVGAVTTTTVLSTLNVVLRQATITVKRVSELRRALHNSSKPRRARRSRSRSLSIPKVPAILKPETISPQLGAAKSAVRRHGRILVELDEPASINVIVQAR